MTGDLAKAVMFPWKEKFVEKFARLEIVGKLYTRYSDDQNIVVEEVRPWSRYNENEGKIEIVRSRMRVGGVDWRRFFSHLFQGTKDMHQKVICPDVI